MKRNITEGTWYSNSKRKSRYVVQKEYNTETSKTRIVYVTKSLDEPVRSCYIGQFLKWAES